MQQQCFNMKAYSVFVFLLLLQLMAAAQPTGSSGIYFNVYHIADGDTVFDLSKITAAKKFDRTGGLKNSGYKILDEGEKKYGFSKTAYNTFVCKEYFWYEENRMSITLDKTQRMNIRFINFPVAYYFINIPFQPGNFEFVFPEDSTMDALQTYLPQKRIDEKLYGYNITPANWAKHKIIHGNKTDTAAHSILPDVMPPMPWYAAWSGILTQRKLAHDNMLPKQFDVKCTVNNGQVIFEQRPLNKNDVTVWKGNIVTAADSIYHFYFYDTYHLSTIDNEPGDTILKHWLLTDSLTTAQIKAVIISKGSVYAATHAVTKLPYKNGTFSLKINNVPALNNLKAGILFSYNNSVMATEKIQLPADGRPLRFSMKTTAASQPFNTFTFRLRNGMLELINTTMRYYYTTLTLQRKTY